MNHPNTDYDPYEKMLRTESEDDFPKEAFEEWHRGIPGKTLIDAVPDMAARWAWAKHDAEVRALKADVKEWRTIANNVGKASGKKTSQIDTLKAEVKRLEKCFAGAVEVAEAREVDLPSLIKDKTVSAMQRQRDAAWEDLERLVTTPPGWHGIGRSRWSCVSTALSRGSGHAIALCKKFGVDPYEVKL